ncbi:hypothetical protein [Pedococcus sp. P5_B7]
MDWLAIREGFNTNVGSAILGGLVVLVGVLLERRLSDRTDERRGRRQAASLLARDVFMLRDAVLSQKGAKGNFDIWPLRSQITAARFFYSSDELDHLEVLVERARELRRWLQAGLGGSAEMRGTRLGDELAETAELRGDAARQVFGRHAQDVIDLLHGDWNAKSRHAFAPPPYPDLAMLAGEDPDWLASADIHGAGDSVTGGPDARASYFAKRLALLRNGATWLRARSVLRGKVDR